MHLLDVLARMEIIAFLELAAKCSGEQGGDRGLARSGDAHDDGDHRFGDGVREGRGPHVPGPRTTPGHPFLPDHPPGDHAAADGRTNFPTALAKPSFALLSVTALA